MSLNADDQQEWPPVVVVVHGSRSGDWVAQQRDWFEGVSAIVHRKISGARVALTFLEITPPLLEDSLAILAKTTPHILIFPFFVIRGGHVLKDIPELVERACAGKCTHEMIEPQDSAILLGRNAERRLKSYGATSGDSVVVCGYGSSSGPERWLSLVSGIRSQSGMYSDTEWKWAPTGHYLDDSAAPLRLVVKELVGKGKTRIAILPLYLGISSYQNELIPGVMREFPGIQFHTGIDAVLPDTQIEAMAADTILGALEKFNQPTMTQ